MVGVGGGGWGGVRRRGKRAGLLNTSRRKKRASGAVSAITKALKQCGGWWNDVTHKLTSCYITSTSSYIWQNSAISFWGGDGIAQWLERRTRDWKVAGSNPCWNGGRIFFSGVDFLCWLLFRYPFHPRVTAVARKKNPGHSAKSAGGRLQLKHAFTLRMWLLLNRASALVTTCP